MNFLQTAEYVSKHIGSKCDFNVGKAYLNLFCALPDHVLSEMKLSKRVFHKQWSCKEHYEYIRFDSTLSSIVSRNMKLYLQKSEYNIHENINKDIDLFVQNEYVFIEDIFDYMNQILADIVLKQCYGEGSLNDPKLFDSVMRLLEKKIAYGEKYLGDLFESRIINEKTNSDKAREYLRDFVLKGKFKKMNRDIIDRDHLIGDRLSNFLIDISLDPRVFKKLENEQRAIIANHGHEISISCLDKMIYLDAAIIESLRLSSNAMTMKEAQYDIFLPNRVFIPKGSLVKLNNINYFRSTQIFDLYPHDFIPERHFKLGTKLDAISKTNLSWGLGRVCPYKEYCAKFMKMFTATLIRSYKVSQGEQPQEYMHGGYFFDDVIRHAKASLYLSRRYLNE
ncbi:hypothetical protein BB560_006819 [Smittium megazygosporum]|uniref:Cytochrome P450 n=1 Tax=Smittium megazygosporum TaxID=133381 RepID=A0A2T9Y155_9FUNG|nr:hypothetical protein BB560_006819 [Smittium megazygosporum]